MDKGRMEAIETALAKLPREPWTEARASAQFDRKGNDPAQWQQRAKALLAASASLEAQWCDAIERIEDDDADDATRRAMDFMEPAIMLRAMAFECLLKSRLLAQGAVLASGGRFRKIPGVKGHDLVALARKSGFALSEQEAGVLRALARWISAGRYPIQLHWSDQTRLLPGGRVQFLTAGWNPYRDKHCATMLERLGIEPAEVLMFGCDDQEA